MKKRKAHLIINPRDGQNVAKLLDILAVLAAANYKTTIALKEYGGHAQELAQQAAEEGDDLVIAYGGDGTLNQVVNGVVNAGGKSVVGVLPGGTANLWATEMGLPTDDPVKAALALLDSEAHRVDIGHASVEEIVFPGISQESKRKQEKAAARSHFLLMAGLGLDAAVMQGVSKPLKHRIKQLAVGLSAFKELPAYHPFPLEIRGADHQLLWQGEAIQVIIGNTRLYADILHMTPGAYIDDGKLDVCVITNGDFAQTIQQIFSLLLRRQPDSVTAEYFRDTRLFIKAPAHVALQLDGSTIELRKFLKKGPKKALKAATKPEEVLVEYAFETIPHALSVAVPRSYDNELFKKSGTGEQVEQNDSKAVDKQVEQRDSTAADVQTEAPGDALPELLASVRTGGRKVNVVGTSRDAQCDAYILAGNYIQEGTGAAKPAAVRVNKSTTILNEKGEKLSLAAVQKLPAGHEVLVSGEKSKRGVIQAQALVL